MRLYWWLVGRWAYIGGLRGCGTVGACMAGGEVHGTIGGCMVRGWDYMVAHWKLVCRSLVVCREVVRGRNIVKTQ